MRKQLVLAALWVLNSFPMFPTSFYEKKCEQESLIQIMILAQESRPGEFNYQAIVVQSPKTFEELKKDNENLVQVLNITACIK